MEFSGKNALITGGSRGIGRAVAEAFARNGARVAIVYQSNEKAARNTINSLPGGPHFAIKADVADRESVESLIDEAIDKLGRIDILVNNAGVALKHRIDEIEFSEWESAWEKTLAVNLFAPANIMYFVVRHMIQNGGGRIVNVSSRGAFRGEPDMPGYAASKAGLNAMSQSLARKLGKYNITVGVVAPGFVETDMAASYLNGPEGDAIKKQSSWGRVAKPEEVAAAVLFLCQDNTEFTTGTIIDVNGASYLRS